MNSIENLKDLIIYQSQNNENISVEVLYNEEDFWLTQKTMAELFNVKVNTINYHLKEIFNSDDEKYGGSGVINRKPLVSDRIDWNGRQSSIELKVPPLGITILRRTLQNDAH